MKRVTLLMYLVFLFSAAAVRAQRDYTFVGMDGSNTTNWFSNANWRCTPPDPSCSVPSADDVARIGRTNGAGYDRYSPRALGAVGVKQLFILDGSTLNFTNFTASQLFIFADLPASAARLEAISSGSVFNNNGAMTIPSQGQASTFSGSFTFFNNGTVNSWNLFVTGGPTITNQPNASFFIHATNGSGIGASGPYTFNNFGILSKPSSPGLATVSPINLINNGSVEVGSGTFQIGGSQSSVTSNCGRFQTLAAAAVLLIQAAITINPCPSLAPPGDVSTNFFGPGPVRFQNNIFLNGGDFRVGFAHPVSGAITGGNLEFQSDSILGNGNIRLVADAQNASAFTIFTGQIGGSGNFNIDSGGTFNIAPSAGSVNLNTRIFNNSGNVVWTGGAIGNSSTAFTFNNLVTGLFWAKNDSSFSSALSPQAVFNNAGTFRKSIGTGTTSILLNFNSTGTVDVQSGTLRFNTTAPNNNRFSGNFNIAAGAFVEFGVGTAGFELNPGFTSTGAGAIRIPGGVSTKVNGSISLSNLHLIGGTLEGTAAGNTVSITGNNTVIDNGIMKLLRFSENFGTRIRFQGSNNFLNDGTTVENRGDLIAPHNTSLRQNSGAAFQLNNFGNLFPGDPIGTMFMDGNFTQGPTGALKIDIGGTAAGTQYDQLRIFAGAAGSTGGATLGGSLNVNFVNGYVPAHNHFFQFMTCQNGCNGQFSKVTGVNVGSDRILVPGYGINAVSLITTQVSGSLPPPTLQSARTSGASTLVSGSYTGPPNTTFLITINIGCSGTGEETVDTTRVTTGPDGLAVLSLFLFQTLVPGTQLSARATDANNLTSNPSNCVIVQSKTATADFDGDRKTDLSIYRVLPGSLSPAADSQWWFQQSSDNVTKVFTFGTATDKIVPGDYDGDGKTDIAFFRPSSGEWFILRSSNLTYYSVPFGLSTDKPAPGDFDGDGKTDVTVFRPSQSTWYISKSSGGVDVVQFGVPTDIPQPADYDGDGKSDIAIYRPTGGSGQAEWWISKSTGGIIATPFGSSSDKPVPGDYTGDGKVDIAFWRPANGNWFVLRSEDFSYYAVPFGVSSDIPAPGDYDGDGKADTAVFRPSGAVWFVNRSTAGILIQQFGLSTDAPVPSAYVP